MVFGNMGNDCATGVAFTRNPSTGENSFYGEYLINAQGEDVVAGIRTPRNITKKARLESSSEDLSLEETMPEAFNELTKIYKKLESHYRDMQDIEFTIEKSYMKDDFSKRKVFQEVYLLKKIKHSNKYG